MVAVVLQMGAVYAAVVLMELHVKIVSIQFQVCFSNQSNLFYFEDIGCNGLMTKCQNGGTCLSNGLCVCRLEFTGIFCGRIKLKKKVIE